MLNGLSRLHLYICVITLHNNNNEKQPAIWQGMWGSDTWEGCVEGREGGRDAVLFSVFKKITNNK